MAVTKELSSGVLPVTKQNRSSQAVKTDKTVFLIDAHALCYRAFFAIKELRNSQGQATNAIYGFLNILRKLLRDYHPDHMAICFDAGKKTKRQEKFKEYKIHRPTMPDELVSQIPIIKEVVAAYNIPVFELEGFEADDLIATLTKKLSAGKFRVVIVSDDKDMLQLVNDGVEVFSSRQDKILTPEEIKQILGVNPEHVVDYISLAGDKTDNIPGIIGIGEITAQNLINQFGDLQNILKNINNVKTPKLRELLTQQKENAIFSRELALLDAQVPITITPDGLKLRDPDTKKLLALFKKLEFRKFAEEIAQDFKSDAAAISVTILNDPNLASFRQKASRHKLLAYIMEAADPLNHSSCSGLFMALDEDDGVYYCTVDQLSDLKEVFGNPNLVKITYDVKQCFKVFEAHGCVVKGKIFDCMLAAYLLSPAQGDYDITTLAWTYLEEMIASEDKYARETQVLLKLYVILLNTLHEKSLLKLFEEIEMPLAFVLYRMEIAGVGLDCEFLNRLSVEMQKKMDGLIDQIYKEAGEEFNLNSPKQLCHILFEKLKITPVKKTKTGFSTDEGVLLKLAEKHKIAALIIEYRQVAKLKSTYIDALPKLISPKTGRVHAYFKQTGTETGRLSSVNPNLQNIPIRTEAGRQIRRAFIPAQENHIIVSADYSQIELRILAHLSGDENLKKAFLKDEDIHAYTAALIFDVKEKDVTRDMRDVAKRVNFGISYGMSAFGLSKDLGIPQEEAIEFIEKYFLRYPKVKEFMDNEIEKARQNGFVLTILNRRRYLPEIKSKDMAIRQFAERQAINTPVQGSAADLMKLAMINIQKEIEKEKLASRMIITVHDELVFDVPLEEEKKMISLIRHQMEQSLSLAVPIKVSVKTGKNWLDMKVM